MCLSGLWGTYEERLSSGLYTLLYPALAKDTAAAMFGHTLFPGAPVKGWEVSSQTHTYLWGCLSQMTSINEASLPIQ